MAEKEKNEVVIAEDEKTKVLELTPAELEALKELISNYRHGEWLRSKLKSWGAWGVWGISIIAVFAVIRDTLIGWLSK